MIAHPAADLVTGLAGHRQAPDLGPDQADIEIAASHEGQVADRTVCQTFDHRPGIRTGQREAGHFLAKVANGHAILHVIVEPAHVPAAKIVGPHDPPGAVAPVEQGQITLQAAIMSKRHGKPCAAGSRQLGREDTVQPCLGIRAADFEAREAGNVEKAHIFANRAAFPADNVERVGALQRRRLGESLRCEIERHLEVPAVAPDRAGGRHVGMGRCHLQRPAGRKLFVGIGHHEPARIELAGGLLDIFLVFGERAVTGHIHAIDIGLGLAMDHPFCKRLADAAALQEAGHHRTGGPVVLLAGHRPDQRVAVRRESEGAIDPVPHTGILQHRIALEAEGELVFDPVDILLQQFDAVIPRRTVHHPVLVVDLVDAEQHALLVLPHIGEALEIDDERELLVERLNLGNGLGEKIMVRQWRDRKLDAGHPAHLLGPQAGGIDDMLAADGPLLGHHVPALSGLIEFQHPVMLDHRGAVLLCRAGIGQNRTGGIDIAFAVSPETTQNAMGRQDRAHLAGFLGRHEPDILDADALIDAVGGLQPFPAVRRAGKCQAAGHMHADGLAAFFLDLAEQIDGVGLQRGNVRIRVESMDAAGGMPARSGGQDRPLDQADVGPAHLGEMVDNRGADDATSNNDNTVMRIHRALPLAPEYSAIISICNKGLYTSFFQSDD